MLGDQDVLTALLCCVEFYDIPVKVLRRRAVSFNISDFTVLVWPNGLLYRAGKAVKPWLTGSSAKPDGFRRKVEAAYLDLSPYIVAASELAPIDTKSWTRPRSALSSALRNIEFGYAPLVGFPIAIAFDLARMARRDKV